MVVVTERDVRRLDVVPSLIDGPRAGRISAVSVTIKHNLGKCFLHDVCHNVRFLVYLCCEQDAIVVVTNE